MAKSKKVPLKQKTQYFGWILYNLRDIVNTANQFGISEDYATSNANRFVQLAVSVEPYKTQLIQNARIVRGPIRLPSNEETTQKMSQIIKNDFESLCESVAYLAILEKYPTSLSPRGKGSGPVIIKGKFKKCLGEQPIKLFRQELRQQMYESGVKLEAFKPNRKKTNEEVETYVNLFERTYSDEFQEKITFDLERHEGSLKETYFEISRLETYASVLAKDISHATKIKFLDAIT